MNRTEKIKFIDGLRQSLANASLVVVVQQKGLSVSQMGSLRTKIREHDAHLKVTKNTLARLTVQGTDQQGLSPFFNGPMALAYSSDPVAAAKVVVEFSKENDKLQVLGGYLNGAILEAQEIQHLASLPSLDALRGKIVGLISTPARNLASLVQAPGSQIARVIQAFTSKA